LSLAKAQETFFYDDSDGRLYWKIRPAKHIMWGDKGGNLDKTIGYYKIRFEGKQYQLHNMIWNWHHGKIPEGKTVDHKDKDPSSNYISNLRLGTRRQQNINTKRRGFHWNKQAQKWVASHKLQGKRIH
tara:strand:- start:29 stop:412 length:384 start_codon:yes stop_codon:yes gene_type:complete